MGIHSPRTIERTFWSPILTELLMLILDCENPDTAVQSLAQGAGVTQAALRDVVIAHGPGLIDWETGGEDPSIAVPRMLLSKIGIEIGDVRFDGAYYFHGTRVLRPHSFLQNGILPLGAILDQLWSDLYSLCADSVTSAQWTGLRRELETSGRTPLHDNQVARLYRMKSADQLHHGPFASLVREHTQDPIVGQHDYVKNPEIVEDIAQCIDLNLQERFESHASSCIVKFSHYKVGQHSVESAMLYVLAKLHNEEHNSLSLDGVDCHGEPVPPSDVVYVEEIDVDSNGRRISVTGRRHQADGCLSTPSQCWRHLDASV